MGEREERGGRENKKKEGEGGRRGRRGREKRSKGVEGGGKQRRFMSHKAGKNKTSLAETCNPEYSTGVDCPITGKAVRVVVSCPVVTFLSVSVPIFDLFQGLNSSFLVLGLVKT